MQVVSESYKDTINFGKIIAGHIRPADIICLHGRLGAGKTVLVKGIAEGLGIKGQEVASPSFILMRQHEKGRFPLYHFDLYRLNAPMEIIAAGLEEYLYGEGVAVIEWAERLECLTPKEFLKAELFIKGKNRRLLKISAKGARYKQLSRQIYEDISR